MVVVKRDGKKVAFDGTKIAIAIKKGFDSILPSDERSEKEEWKYSEEDVNFVYNKVIEKINKWDKDKIKIEEIQDIIEEELKENGYEDVYESFSTYRENRAQSREIFFDEKRKHKFLKALEKLGLKTGAEKGSKKEMIQEGNKNAMQTLVAYGSTVSREFATSYLIKKRFAESHENGDIHIHNIDFYPMGTTDTMQIELDKLFKDGFSAGNGYIREPQDIMSYSVLATIAIIADQNDQHGTQSIPAFDFYMASGVLKTFKKQFRQTIYDLLQYTDYDKFIAINGIEREIDRINTLEFDIKEFDKFTRGADELKRLFRIAYKNSMEKTNKLVKQAMEAFIHNVNNMYFQGADTCQIPTINLGTDISKEGRMVTHNILKALDGGIGNNETPIAPVVIFKVKDGVNYKKDDPNYDLLKLACEVCSRRKFPNFSFLDSSFNSQFYKEGDYNTEVSYTSSYHRVIDNFVDEDKAVTGGRGNLSDTTINLPRIGIKHGCVLENSKTDLDAFYEELDEKLELVKDQLLQRFEFQGENKACHFPFLIGQNIWIDSEKLKPDDKVRKQLKQGTLTIGFVGLSECLTALTGKNRVEDKKTRKLGIDIVKHMREKTDEFSLKYNLNFTLASTQTKDMAEEFIAIDQAIFGKIDKITNKEKYTNSFQIPQTLNISIDEKIEIEAPYHEYTNGGHVLVLQIDQKKANGKTVEECIQKMKQAQIGYGKVRFIKK